MYLWTHTHAVCRACWIHFLTKRSPRYSKYLPYQKLHYNQIEMWDCEAVENSPGRAIPSRVCAAENRGGTQPQLSCGCGAVILKCQPFQTHRNVLSKEYFNARTASHPALQTHSSDLLPLNLILHACAFTWLRFPAHKSTSLGTDPAFQNTHFSCSITGLQGHLKVSILLLLFLPLPTGMPKIWLHLKTCTCLQR